MQQAISRVNGQSQRAKESPSNRRGFFLQHSERLEEIPEQLIVDVVVELHLRRLDDRAQQAGAAVRRSLLQIGVASLHIRSQQSRRPLRPAEVLKRGVDIV